MVGNGLLFEKMQHYMLYSIFLISSVFYSGIILCDMRCDFIHVCMLMFYVFLKEEVFFRFVFFNCLTVKPISQPVKAKVNIFYIKLFFIQ